MKFSLLALTLVGVVSANRPQLSIQVKDGSYDGLDGLDPSLSWSTSADCGDYDVEVGVDASVRPTTDIASLPKGFWGTASRKFGSWGVSARADVSRDDMSNADVEINANNDGDDLSVKVLANAGAGGSSVNSITATKGFSSGDARVTVSPSVDMASRDVDVTIGYGAGDLNVEVVASKDSQTIKASQQVSKQTNVEVVASADEQTITVSQQVDSANRVAPSFAVRSGNVAVEWERDLGDDNSLTTTLRPNQDIDMTWKDAAWEANINMPIDGTSIGGANVSIKRDVNF